MITDQERAAARERLRANLIRTLVQQGADEAFASLYVDARVTVHDLFSGESGEYKQACATIGKGDDAVTRVDTPEQLRSFARAMRHADPRAALGAKQLPTMSRKERIDLARDNLIGALVEQGAAGSFARRYVNEHVQFGLTSSDGDAIAVLKNGAQFEDTPETMVQAAQHLQALDSDAPLTSVQTEEARQAANTEAKRQQLAGAF